MTNYGQARRPESNSEQLVLTVGGGAAKFAMVFMASICLCFAAMVIIGLVPRGGHRNLPISISFGILLLLMVLFLVLATGASGTVTGDSLFLKKSRWARLKKIALSDVVAVGMVYTIQPRISGWRSYVWTNDGAPTLLPIGLCMGPLPATAEALRLGRTREGNLCRRLFERVESVQGSTGIALNDRQAIRRGSMKRETAYWSANPAVQSVQPIDRRG